MLGKLIKHEFKALNRYMIPLNLAVIVITIIGKLFISFHISQNIHPLFTGLALIMYILVLFVSTVAVYILCVVRFYRNMYTSEGYLMHTLPVKPWQHIVSKFTAKFVWTQINLLLVVISIITLLVPDVVSIYQLNATLKEAYNIYYIEFGHSLVIMLIYVLIIYIIASISSTMLLYTAISLGQLFAKHKVLGSFIVYFIITMVNSLLSTIISILMSASVIRQVTTTDSLVSYNYIMTQTFPGMNATLILNILLVVAGFFATNYVMSHKLNLD